MFSRFVVSQVKHNSYFLVGLVLGLWLALVAVPFDEDIEPCISGSSQPLIVDEYEPQREEKPLGSAGQAAGRSVQRPRYYSTELGIRKPLLTGILSSENALATQVAALNVTTARLQPDLRFFITASTLQAAPGLTNVVGFTDTREMLKPFHALKYLADNYLEEYDFFFLITDTSYINALDLTELVSQISVSQDIYMGTIAEDDSHYCSLESGVLLSNSVVRAVHSELDWCVRNSYSPHHHENIGRCVLHAAHTPCRPWPAPPAQPAAAPPGLLAAHALAARQRLQTERREARHLRGFVWRNSRRHPPYTRNATWPGGLRLDPGLSPPPPDSRFDYLRWTAFNTTHAFMPDELHAVAPIPPLHARAVRLVWREVEAWAQKAWGARVQLLEGAWRWEPAQALHYRLTVRAESDTGSVLRLVEVVRPLGAARLVAVPYVTESARVWLVVPVTEDMVSDSLSFLQRYEAICLNKDRNTALYMVTVGEEETEDWGAGVRAAVQRLADKYRDARVIALRVPSAPDVGRASVGAAAAEGGLSRDSLVLLLPPHADFNEEFLNRVRMNTIAGHQWFLVGGFARFSQYTHPRFLDADGNRPQVNTGRFNLLHRTALAFYRRDYDSAVAEWGSGTVSEVLARSSLHCLSGPEPGLVLAPRPAPCPAGPDGAVCLKELAADGFLRLDLGAKHALAKMLLEMRADAER